ncbi:hypothetical protein ACS0TY_017491 [Phlomoides rotata]
MDLTNGIVAPVAARAHSLHAQHTLLLSSPSPTATALPLSIPTVRIISCRPFAATAPPRKKGKFECSAFLLETLARSSSLFPPHRHRLLLHRHPRRSFTVSSSLLAKDQWTINVGGGFHHCSARNEGDDN